MRAKTRFLFYAAVDWDVLHLDYRLAAPVQARRAVPGSPTSNSSFRFVPVDAGEWNLDFVERVPPGRRSAQVGLVRGEAGFAARGGVRRVGRGPEEFSELAGDSGTLPDGIVDGDDVQRIDDVADALLVKEGNFFRSERDEISLRDDEPPSVRQLNRKRLEPVDQAFLDIVDNHLLDIMIATAASQNEWAKERWVI